MNDSIEEMLQTAETLARATGHSFGSSSKIEVHAGGAAIWGIAWFCSICAAFMAGAMMVGGLWVSGEFTQSAQDDTELRQSVNANKAYLSALFQRNPGLKAELDQAKEPKK